MLTKVFTWEPRKLCLKILGHNDLFLLRSFDSQLTRHFTTSHLYARCINLTFYKSVYLYWNLLKGFVHGFLNQIALDMSLRAQRWTIFFNVKKENPLTDRSSKIHLKCEILFSKLLRAKYQFD